MKEFLDHPDLHPSRIRGLGPFTATTEKQGNTTRALFFVNPTAKVQNPTSFHKTPSTNPQNPSTPNTPTSSSPAINSQNPSTSNAPYPQIYSTQSPTTNSTKSPQPPKAFLIKNKNTLELRTDPKLSHLLQSKYESVMQSRYFGRGGIEIVPTGQLAIPELIDLIRLSYHLTEQSKN